MPFKKGQVGNPFGITGEKLYRDAMRKAALAIDEATGKRKVRLVAEKAVALALKGEPWAVQHVAERMDGKAATEAVVTVQQSGEVRQLSDDELMAIIAKQAIAERKEDETLQ
jgi:hypothetical protein